MNDFAIAKKEKVETGQGLVQAEVAKQVQEVQAALVIAKSYPRDEAAAYAGIMTACQRIGLAEKSQYVYPRGGQTFDGPSIRLAEAMAGLWGNLDYGIRELSQADGVSEVEAFCWDMQTNVRKRVTFSVPHIRYSKNKGNTKLTDPRDIYEMVANQGARRVRACILAVIPGDIVEAAVKECNKTLAGGSDEPIEDRIKKMIALFKKHSVTREMIEVRLGHKISVTSEAEVLELGKIYTSINDNMSNREQYFEIPRTGETAEDIEEELQNARASDKKPVKKKDAGKPASDGGIDFSGDPPKQPE